MHSSKSWRSWLACHRLRSKILLCSGLNDGSPKDMSTPKPWNIWMLPYLEKVLADIIELWILRSDHPAFPRCALNVMTCVLTGDKKRKTYRREGDWSPRQTLKCYGHKPRKTAMADSTGGWESKERFFLTPWFLDFWLPELGKNKFLLF